MLVGLRLREFIARCGHWFVDTEPELRRSGGHDEFKPLLDVIVKHGIPDTRDAFPDGSGIFQQDVRTVSHTQGDGQILQRQSHKRYRWAWEFIRLESQRTIRRK